ncbi:MAG TPA: sigma-70 family RNA polymerase sigma factor [Acidimicrobiales bacterium]|nr:sigma-70 family RNA polymerase sigma factor [Acidimicrobiales bacterium]
MDYASAGDGALVAAIGRWQDAALAEVFRRHSGAVHGLARRVLGSGNLAEEVTQEVFLGLWREPEAFDIGRAPLRTLLLTKAHSRAVDLVRAEASRHAREQRTASDRAAAGYDLERYVWDLAVAEQVKTAVEALPDGERKAIELAYFDGRTYRDVATLLGEPEGTIKSRIRSGLRRLRSLLSEHGVESPWIDS